MGKVYTRFPYALYLEVAELSATTAAMPILQAGVALSGLKYVNLVFMPAQGRRKTQPNTVVINIGTFSLPEL